MNQEPHFRKPTGKRPPAIVHDRRRTGPLTLLPPRRDADDRAGSAPQGPAARPPDTVSGGPPSETARLRAELVELTADLQRVKAEYDNYRKRVRRDRLAVREIAVANVLAGLLPVLDAADDACGQRDDEGTRALARALEDRLAALGLQTVGEPGEPFDPTAHEALMYTTSADVAEPVCTAVLRHGYRVGDQLLRPAQVAVTGPLAGGEAAGSAG
ncbi:nucleotide exchange factor GrpE [Streptomyces sp. NPDC015127]|uniref:nucleotide exchange factor GrpE n=1 Tax=Streptomyces sp. NPDC015127 TaxID=3364939 RepID=UPI0036FF81D5